MRERSELDRRTFLRHAGVGLGTVGLGTVAPFSVSSPAPPDGPMSGVAAAAQPPAPIRFTPIHKATERPDDPLPNPEPPDRRVGYALVGLGRLTLGQLLPAMAGSCKRSKPAALVTGDLAKGRAVARQYGIDERKIYTYRDYDRLRDDAAVEAVFIVLPNSMHAEYTVRAAEAGKHVLCEKPMANTVAECEQMIAACARARRKLMIAYRIQYEPHHRIVQRIARGEEPDTALGRLTLLEMVISQAQGDPEQWRLKRALAGGGALPDIGLYCLNTARFLTGEEPIEIRALEHSTPGDPRFREVEETMLFQLRFPSGTLANCTTSYGAHTNKRYRASFEDGWVEMDPAFSYTGLRLRTARKRDGAERLEEHQIGEHDQFALEIDHFSACVRDDRQPYTPGEEGLQDQRLMEAIYRAAREGRPVTMPPVARRDAFRGPLPSSA